MVLSKSKERNRRGGEAEVVALIPELCRATGITEEMRSNFQTMRTLSEVTRLQPRQRVERLIKFSRRINETEDSRKALSNLGMKLSNELISLEGRMLEKPSIQFRTSEKFERDFANSLRNELFHALPLDNWCVISTERDARQVADFIQNIRRSVRFHISHPNHVTVRRDSIEEIMREMQNVSRNDVQMIMIVLPRNQADKYQAIKKYCCIQRSIPTQVVTARSLSGRNAMSVATKIAIQMTCKIGGAPWGIKIPLTGILTIGYDVSHDTKKKNLSFGALVATLDQHQSAFFSTVSQNDDGIQLSKTFTLDVIKAVRAYKDKNGSNPTKIIIYRDGVGDGQIRHVLDYEKDPLEAMLKEQLGDEIRFAFIIVNKKTNTRLFAQNDRGFDNPRPGTVVDTAITLPERYDFFLVPTSVRQATVSPTYFNVIYDTLGLPAARLQLLSYYMCHGYYNWTDAIAVPAVCKYAGKLAFLCSQHLHSPPSPSMERLLYFL